MCTELVPTSMTAIFDMMENLAAQAVRPL